MLPGLQPLTEWKVSFFIFSFPPPIRGNWAHIQEEALLRARFCFALWLGLPLLPWQGLNLPNSVSHLLNGANSASFLLACAHGEPVDVHSLRAAAVPGPGHASCVLRRGCFLWASVPGAEGGTNGFALDAWLPGSTCCGAAAGAQQKERLLPQNILDLGLSISDAAVARWHTVVPHEKGTWWWHFSIPKRPVLVSLHVSWSKCHCWT